MNEQCVTVLSTVDKVFVSLILFPLFSMLFAIFLGIGGIWRKNVDEFILFSGSGCIVVIFAWFVYLIWS